MIGQRWNVIEAQPRDRRGRVRLAQRQGEMVQAIRRLTRQHGYPPTIRELMADMEIQSSNGVKTQLRLLRRKGWVDWQDGKARTLRIMGE